MALSRTPPSCGKPDEEVGGGESLGQEVFSTATPMASWSSKHSILVRVGISISGFAVWFGGNAFISETNC